MRQEAAVASGCRTQRIATATSVRFGVMSRAAMGGQGRAASCGPKSRGESYAVFVSTVMRRTRAAACGVTVSGAGRLPL